MSDVDLTGLTEKENQAGTKYFVDNYGDMIAKKCTRCNVIKSESDFYVSEGRRLGRPHCKSCVSKVNNRNSKYNRDYYVNNKNYYKEYRLRYYTENKEYFKIYSDKYNKENRDRITETKRNYREKNRALFRMYDARRRAREKALPDTLTNFRMNDITKYFNGKCSLTGGSEDVHLDHTVPIATGHGGTIYENMAPLRADLNHSKSDQNIFDWFAENRERFELSQQRFDELTEYMANINEVSTKEYEEFVYWCHDNPRTVEQIEADNERYGYKKPSIEIWREEVAKESRELVEV